VKSKILNRSNAETSDHFGERYWCNEESEVQREKKKKLKVSEIEKI